MKVTHFIPAAVMAVAIGVSAMAVAEPQTTGAVAKESATPPPSLQPETPQGMVFTNDTIDRVQSPRDPATGQASGVVQNSATPAPDHEIEYDLVRKRADHEGEIDCVANCTAASGLATGRRQHLPVAEVAEANPQEATNSGASTTAKKPRRNRTGTRGKRQHKP